MFGALSVSTNALSNPRTYRGITSLRYTLALILTDYLVAWASFVVGLLALSTVSNVPGNSRHFFLQNLQHAYGFPLCTIFAMALTSQYRRSRRSPTQNVFSEFRETLLSATFGGFCTLVASTLLHHFTPWAVEVTSQIVFATLVAGSLLTINHGLLRHVVLSHHPVRVAIVDDGADYERIATHLHLQHGVVEVGRIAPEDDSVGASIGSLSHIDELVTTHKLDRVIFGSINMLTPGLAASYRRATELVDTALVPRMHEVISWRSRLTDLSGLPVLELAPRHVSLFDRALKRTLDILIATTVLLLTLPLTIGIALAVKVTSPGPIFFRQERLGLHREPFTIFKFRTMNGVATIERPDRPLEVDGSQPLYLSRRQRHESGRHTPIGKFLRQSGLDELPQMLMVLWGTMSIVGPRPFITSESVKTDSWSEVRYEVRPGITGLWQVSGRNNLSGDELRQLDYLYVSGWSLWWDIKICFDTPRAMLRGLGAY